MSIYSVNILSVCLMVMLQKALLLMDVFILVFILGGRFPPGVSVIQSVEALDPGKLNV